MGADIPSPRSIATAEKSVSVPLEQIRLQPINWQGLVFLAWLVGVLVVRSIERSERVYQAMLCRGFAGTFWLLDHFVWRPADTLFCVLGGLGIVLLGLMQWGGVLWN